MSEQKWLTKPFTGQDVFCPKCDAKPRERCRNLVTGRVMKYAHDERVMKERKRSIMQGVER